jgi:hypothetical protein
VPPTTDSYSFGDTFNAIGGGVYALEWTDEAIKIWHFPRTAIPDDITAKQPDPSTWGEPEALFGGSNCDVDDYFNDMSIVLNMVQTSPQSVLSPSRADKGLGLLRCLCRQPVGRDGHLQHGHRLNLC